MCWIKDQHWGHHAIIIYKPVSNEILSLPEIPSVQQSVEQHMFTVSDWIINISFLKVGARPDSFMRPLPALLRPPTLFTSPRSSKLPLGYRLLNIFLNQKHLTFTGQWRTINEKLSSWKKIYLSHLFRANSMALVACTKILKTGFYIVFPGKWTWSQQARALISSSVKSALMS